jgi:hypothetical protein
MIEVIEKMYPYSIEVGDTIKTVYGNCVIKGIGSNYDNTIFICEDVYDIEHVLEVNDNMLVPVVFMVEEEVE